MLTCRPHTLSKVSLREPPSPQGSSSHPLNLWRGHNSPWCEAGGLDGTYGTGAESGGVLLMTGGFSRDAIHNRHSSQVLWLSRGDHGVKVSPKPRQKAFSSLRRIYVFGAKIQILSLASSRDRQSPRMVGFSWNRFIYIYISIIYVWFYNVIRIQYI